MLLKIARERSVRLSTKNSAPSVSAPQWTAARSLKNWPTALKKSLTLFENDVEASTSATSRQAYALRRRPASGGVGARSSLLPARRPDARRAAVRGLRRG